MIIIPAIDIRGGQCVRLTEGRFDKETVYAANPADMVGIFADQGAEYLHLVDLDGALAGSSQNLTAIKNVLSKAKMPVELGGGIRSIANIEMILALGVSRVILGSVAVKQPELVAEACRKFPAKIVVGIDAKDGVVAVEGWGQSGDMQAVELAKQMAQVGVDRIIFTDIARDGKLSGANVEATAELARQAQLKVIASGGVTSLADIRQLKQYEGAGIEGCIVGKALYTKAIDLAAAIKCAREE
ncbi:MAG: 1-(5-phosphoribosyl)-5-[(5-phosphoribosylamino)methylideneamino]imidazole-4-carboxamide isomerase [Acidaminococcaceae bacterium]|jgi:phosphoribosylformimino-5-aminoimidazole carboxamide ribotide isomerase|nr:1-(5-phosphoribosyl)-5-[(5-phosphoribosylamino)methylideneamino]imidazole-4-carboxamide isomerase [Acidaminococcaceae bacterium]